ncbi:MAG: replication terminator protein [Oscillospiraceae bacterium]|nr:replication terminator protein [Oscillospiraceae bacterium]
MARQIKQLDELMDGALTERFNMEMDRVLKNVFDPNTDHKTKRQITITVEITPNEKRTAAGITVDVKSKIAPPVKLSQTCFLWQDDEGNVTATEITQQIPGQIDMDGNEQRIPRVVEFGKSSKEKAN